MLSFSTSISDSIAIATDVEADFVDEGERESNDTISFEFVGSVMQNKVLRNSKDFESLPITEG